LWYSEGLRCLHLQGQVDCFLTLKIKAPQSFGTLGSAHPMSKFHASEDLDFQQHISENLMSLLFNPLTTNIRYRMRLLFKFWYPATKHNSGAKGLICVHFASYFHDITCTGCAGIASHYTQAKCSCRCSSGRGLTAPVCCYSAAFVRHRCIRNSVFMNCSRLMKCCHTNTVM
jgi:hypothetical protein